MIVRSDIFFHCALDAAFAEDPVSAGRSFSFVEFLETVRNGRDTDACTPFLAQQCGSNAGCPRLVNAQFWENAGFFLFLVNMKQVRHAHVSPWS
ncbi:hypothetical protein DUNSADRAFT_13030 [Dunaliella salina]|uniref:Encoded protein n=1 Tax=Dunaliella salina TaxID=3046 RepID=A0ABQ7GA65_DUNSA|nr:hypothetical protein DUNSADRAFT_13030 [Dunaliella salina]|eukprot:KAF5831499.1 hypothetical protein DUNSADRAFT_13030 [Dunaliella salina]